MATGCAGDGRELVGWEVTVPRASKGAGWLGRCQAASGAGVTGWENYPGLGNVGREGKGLDAADCFGLRAEGYSLEIPAGAYASRP